MYLFKTSVSKVALAVVLSLVSAGVLVEAAPAERTKTHSVSASVGGPLAGPNQFNGNVSISTDVTTTNGVTETSSTVFIDASSQCGASHFPFNDNLTTPLVVVSNRGKSGTASFSGVLDGNTWEITITASGPTAFSTVLRGTIEDASGSNKLSVSGTETAATVGQIDISLNGTPCYSGPFGTNPWGGGGFVSASEYKITTTAP